MTEAGGDAEGCRSSAARDGASLSVVIPASSEEHQIGSLLSDMTAQTRKAHEVMVVDAGSEDDTVSIVKRFSDVVLLPGSLPVARRNLGGRSARGDTLIFLDGDVKLSQGFFEGFLEESKGQPACPSYVPYRSTPAIRGIHASEKRATINGVRKLHKSM